MLEALIRSWSSLKIPNKVSPVFVVIENDDEEKSKSVIQNLEPLFNKSRLTYALEKEPGIPFARNRAAQEAINISADLLLFVDDDEEVDIDRVRLLSSATSYLESRQLAIEWDSLNGLELPELVDTLAASLPFSSREKQGLVETLIIQDRCELLSALCEFAVEYAIRGEDRTH